MSETIANPRARSAKLRAAAFGRTAPARAEALMRRFMHILAIAALIGSAVYSYRIKYDTLYLSEQVAKLKSRLQRDQEAIAVLRAEWQIRRGPDRIQTLADKHLHDLEPAAITQPVRWAEIRRNRRRRIPSAPKLEELGSPPDGDAIRPRPATCARRARSPPHPPAASLEAGMTQMTAESRATRRIG